MDFDKTARELLACCGSCLSGGHLPGCAQYKFQKIAAALKAAYNEGCEAAAVSVLNFDIGCTNAAIARSKKVP